MSDPMHKNEANNGEYIVYCHTDPEGKKYIGITLRSMRRRMREGYAHSPRLKAAVEKYGWDKFTHKILAEGVSKEKAELLEEYYVETYDTRNPAKGYNTQKGGK